MYRIKKGRHSPRTLYNGPFVLPYQNSLMWENKASTTPCLGPKSSLYSHWPDQPVAHTQQGFSQTHQSSGRPWLQTRLRPFRCRNEMGTPRSDEVCRPVFNLSFLDDSSANNDITSQQHERLSTSSPRGVWPHSKGHFGHLPYSMTKTSPLSKVSTAPTYSSVNQIVSSLHASNKVSTPRLNNFLSPKLSTLPFSRISPSSDTDTGNESSQSRYEHLHQHQISNPRNQKEVWPSLLGNAYPTVSSCRQNQTPEMFFPRQNQQLYPSVAGFNNSLNEGTFYQCNPAVSDSIGEIVPGIKFQQNSVCNQQQQNIFTNNQRDHQSLFYRNYLFNNDEYNFPQTVNGQTVTRVDQCTVHQNPSKIKNYQTNDQTIGTRVSNYTSLQRIPRSTTFRPFERSYLQKGYVHDLQIKQEYHYQNKKDSPGTKQSSFYSSLLPTNQSHNIISSEQKTPKSAQCEHKDCFCRKPQQISNANQEKLAVGESSPKVKHIHPNQFHTGPKDKNADPNYMLRDASNIQANCIVYPHGKQKETHIRSIEFGNTKHRCKCLGYRHTGDSSYQLHGDHHYYPHRKGSDKSSWRYHQVIQPRRSDNAYHNVVTREFSADCGKRGRQRVNLKGMSERPGTWHESGQLGNSVIGKPQAALHHEDQSSSKFKKFRPFENKRLPGTAPGFSNATFKRAKLEGRRQKYWAQGRGRSRFCTHRAQVVERGVIPDSECSKINRDGNSRFNQDGKHPTYVKNIKFWEDEVAETVPSHTAQINGSKRTLLQKFAEELKRFQVIGGNPIQTLHDCANCSSLSIQILFSIDPFYKNNIEDGFIAELSINGKCIARRTGKSKRLVKQKVYELALSQLLQTTSGQDAVSKDDAIGIQTRAKSEKVTVHCNSGIGDNVDGGEGQYGKGSNLTPTKDSKALLIQEKSRYDNIERAQFQHKVPDIDEKKTGLGQTTLCHLNHLIHDLRLFREGESSKVSQIWTVDKHCVKNRLKLIAIYKGNHQPNEHMTITCDLYLCERFLAQGKGANRKFAQMYAYRRTCEILRSMDSAKDVLTLPRIDRNELRLPDVIDVVHKGYQVVEESNLCRMNRTKQPPLEHRNLNSLIILEHEDWSRDRKKHAHCILVQSATQCGCLLEWRSEPCSRGFRCTMTLQGEQIASCITQLRKDAVRMASIFALFLFYETQPVVQGFHIDYPSVWITRSQLIEKANATATSPDVADSHTSSPVDVANKHLDFCASMPKEDKYKLQMQLEDGVAYAIERLVEEFNKRKTLDMVVCAPNWRTEEKRFLRGAATGNGLRVVTENFQEEQILVISHKHSLMEIYNILKTQPGKAQGRYKILRDEEKPCFMDVAAEIEANESDLGERALKVLRPNLISRFNFNPAQSLNKHLKDLTGSKRLEQGTPGLDLFEAGHTFGKSDYLKRCPSSSTCNNLSPTNFSSEGRNEKTRQNQSYAKTMDDQKKMSLMSSSNSDVYVSANNTVEKGRDEQTGAAEIHDASATSTLGGHCPGECSTSIKAQSPDEFSRPRITSTPSSHKDKGPKASKTKSSESRVSEANVNAHRALSFVATSRFMIAQDASGNLNSNELSEHLPPENDTENRKSPPRSLPSTLSPTPSDPSSAKLNDPFSNTSDSQTSEAQCKEKSWQCGKSLEVQHNFNISSPQKLLHMDQVLSAINDCYPKRHQRQKMDGSVDLEACLGSPEQHAVCIIKHQSSKCVPFSSEFETCNETNFH